MMAYRTQEKLKSQLYSCTGNRNVEEYVEEESVKDTQDTTKRIEDRGLLHTILTKVHYDQSTVKKSLFIDISFNYVSICRGR